MKKKKLQSNAEFNEDDIFNYEITEEDYEPYSEEEEEDGAGSQDVHEEEAQPEDTSAEGDEGSEDGEGGAEGEEEDQPKARKHHKPSFNKRIGELTKKRREAERERDAERAKTAELERRIKMMEAQQSETEASAIEQKLAGLKSRLAAARMNEDYDDEIEIQKEIAMEVQRQQVHKARKYILDEELKTQAEAVKEVHQDQPKGPHPKVHQILQNNLWILKPETKEQQAVANLANQITNYLVSQGLSPETDAEFAEQFEFFLDKEITKRGLGVVNYVHTQFQSDDSAGDFNPDEYLDEDEGFEAEEYSTPAQQRKTQRVPAKAGANGQRSRAGVSSSSSFKKGQKASFKLTEAEKLIAKSAGMTEAEYARLRDSNRD